jgi:hypothetical protein
MHDRRWLCPHMSVRSSWIAAARIVSKKRRARRASSKNFWDSTSAFLPELSSSWSTTEPGKLVRQRSERRVCKIRLREGSVMREEVGNNSPQISRILVRVSPWNFRVKLTKSWEQIERHSKNDARTHKNSQTESVRNIPIVFYETLSRLLFLKALSLPRITD